MSNALRNCVNFVLIGLCFFTARSFILYTIYIGRHFVYLVLFKF